MSTGRSLPESSFANFLTSRHFVTFGRIGILAVVGILTADYVLSPSAAVPDAASDQHSPSAALPVSVVIAQPVSSFNQTRHYTGALVPRRTADVSFERAARVTEVLVDEGDFVESGQRLALLDTRRLDTRQRVLQAQRDAAAALLKELEMGPRVETIAATRAIVRELRAQLELSRLTHGRTSELHQRNSTSQQAVDNSRLSMEAAGARLAQAEQQLEELEAGTRAEKIAAQQAVVDQLNAELADLQLDRDESVLRAPFAGQVAQRHIDEGTMATPGSPVVTLVESSSIEARIGLPNGLIPSLNVGDSVSLRLNDDDFRAEFARILPQVDLQTRTRIAVFQLTKEDSLRVASGQTVRVSLSEKVEATGYWLPTSALSPGQRGLWSAYVVVTQDEEDRIESRPVEILHTEGDQVLVTGTIHADDRVVAAGVQRVVPGQKVQVKRQGI